MAELDIRFKLNPVQIFRNCPEDPGVYTIEDTEGDVLLIAWGRNLTQSITRHLPENELRNEVIRSRGRFFRFFLTEDETEALRVFDAYVNKKKRFPAGMTKAPEGSAWEGNPDPGAPVVEPAPAPPTLPEPLEPEGDTPSVPEPAPPTLAAAADTPRPAPAAARSGAPAPPDVGDRPLNVVLVDDEVQLLVLMKEFLEMEGHRVHAAANRKMLAEALRVRPLDVMVLDYHLPEIKAETVIQAARKVNPAVLILMITGTQHKEAAYGLLKKGVKKIFPKPFSMKMLNRAILDFFQRDSRQETVRTR